MTLQELKVMIVDDNSLAINLASAVLRSIGVQQIVEAKDGFAAQEILSDDSASIDLIFCDHQMPGMTGLELLESIRRGRSTLPFVMVTGTDDPAFVEAAEQLGISGFIQKPYAPQKLKETLVALVQTL
jgi:two-component system chemotaxis response regulator CheY